MTSAEPSTRREALRTGLAGAGAAFALAALVPMERARAAPGDQAEVDTLARMVRLEQTAAVAYGALADGVLLTRPVADAAALFRRQAAARADALARSLEALGGSRPPVPSPQGVEGLGAVTGQAEFLAFAVNLENRNVRAYLDALAELESPGTLRLCAAAMAAAGQHLVVLRESLGAGPAEAVPSAFETGTSPAPG